MLWLLSLVSRLPVGKILLPFLLPGPIAALKVT